MSLHPKGRHPIKTLSSPGVETQEGGLGGTEPRGKSQRVDEVTLEDEQVKEDARRRTPWGSLLQEQLKPEKEPGK